jgi:hypothetical protein
MAVIKQKTRKRLSKVLARLVKKHGPEMTLALVTGIISAQVAERSNKAPKKTDTGAKPAKKVKAAAKATRAPAKAGASKNRASA